jgi:8-oxo-dGTP pyrophosphatase MutT (NUDIX family)
VTTTKKLRRRGTAIVEYARDGVRGVLVHADHQGNWLLPGGQLNRDRQTGRVIESRLAAAARELREETGLEIYGLTFLFRHKSTYSDHKVFYILAHGDAHVVDTREAPAIGLCLEDMTIVPIEPRDGFDVRHHRLMKGSAAIIERYRELRRLRPGLFRALASARLDPGRETLSLGAMRSDWQTQPMPVACAQLGLNRTFSADEMGKLRRGFIPEAMEEKWFVYYEDQTLFFHRSWTGVCIYQARVQELGDGGGQLISAVVNRDPEQYTATDDAHDVRLLLYLIDGILLGQFVPFPTTPDADEQTGALQAWSMAGQAALGMVSPQAPDAHGVVPSLVTVAPGIAVVADPSMRLLDRLSFTYRGSPRSITIYQGDLTAMPPSEAVDLLVVSALPDDYAPTPQSLVGALDRKGVSVEQLAQRKASDMRPNLACWLSEPVQAADPGIQFQRILCFEPLQRGAPPEVVGDIFQCLISVSQGGTPVRSIAMPLLAGGVQGVSTVDMLIPLFDAANHWMQFGLPIEEIKIVAYDAVSAGELRGAFGVLKHQFEQRPPQAGPGKAYDLFISYSWKNKDAIDAFVAELHKLRPGLRLFLDRQTLQTGCAWQQDLFAALDDCRKILAFYSPDYLASKVCREEFNIAMFRQRDEGGEVLLPVYLVDVALPTYMKMIQYIDCREGFGVSLAQAAAQIVKKL